MAVKVFLPGPLRGFFAGAASVEVEAATVGDALKALAARAPELGSQLLAGDGGLRSYVNLYVNDDDVRDLGGLGAKLAPGDTLSIVPSIAGGVEVDPEKLAAAQAAVRRAGKGELPLTHEEVRRYSRHLILPDVGLAGQVKLKNARVLLIGVGGLGSPLALYLAAAGVGTLGLVDADVVDETNLQRQVIHGTKDVGRPKLDSAADRIHDINPNVKVEKHETFLTSRERARAVPPVRPGRRRNRQLPDALPGERRVRAHGQAERVRHRSSVSKGRRRCSRRRTGRATAASTPSRRPPDSCRRAPRAACSASCRASSACCRRPRS